MWLGGIYIITFHSYDHFKKYCFKIASNKEIKLVKKQYKAFDEFEIVPGFLNQLKISKKIDFKDCVLNKIVALFKSNKIDEATTTMGYLGRKIEKFEKGEVNIYYVFTSFQSMLGMEIEFTEEFINSMNVKDVCYPSKIRVLEITETTEKIYSISTDGIEGKGIFGIYFIYDNAGNLAYIGKSSSCVVTRSIASATERKLIDFLRIEIRETKTKSDIAIYEAYYISKFKPYCNNDLIFEDETTLSLPELPVIKTFKRDVSNDYFEFKYSYVQSKVYDIDIILPKLNDSIFIENDKNKTLLESIGLFDKYTMRKEAYDKCLNEIRENGYINVSDLKFNI